MTKLYRVMFDCEYDYIEAKSFGAAVEIWRRHLIDENEPGDIEATVEPESVELVHDEPVRR
jgi:hypothetical protein